MSTMSHYRTSCMIIIKIDLRGLKSHLKLLFFHTLAHFLCFFFGGGGHYTYFLKRLFFVHNAYRLDFCPLITIYILQNVCVCVRFILYLKVDVFVSVHCTAVPISYEL